MDATALARLPAAARERVQVEISAMRARIARDDPVCDGVDANAEKDAWRPLFEAARAGHVPSMTLFATSRLVRDPQWRGAADMEAIAQYRTYALPFLQQAAAAGDVIAIEQLGAEQLAPGGGTRAIPYDPSRGFAYLAALSARAAPEYRQHLADEMADARARLTPAEIAAADALVPTILPAAIADRHDLVRPEHGPDDDFGCR